MHLEVHAAEAVFEQVNVQAAAELVGLCAQAGVRRLVHTSSVGVYGHVEHPPANEDAVKTPQTAYERTKLAGEVAVLSRAQKTGPELVVLRPAWVFGPGCGRTAKLLRSVRKGAFFYIGRGDNLRHPVFIGDLIDAFVLAGEVITNNGPRVYNIAGPAAVTVQEMVETCARVLGVAPPRFHLPRPAGWLAGALAETIFRGVGREPPFSRRTLAFFSNDNAFSTEAAERELGFRARTDLETGLRRTLAEMEAA
jgi:dihydroflavonol-4-reductase